MKIGEVARATGLTTKTLRYYESIELLPEPTRSPNGYRRYNTDTVDRVRFIRDAQASGLTLAEIGMILDMKDSGESTCGHVIFLLEEHLVDVERQIEDLKRAKARLEEMTDRARRLDPSGCRDPNRCHTIEVPGSGYPVTRQHEGVHQ